MEEVIGDRFQRWLRPLTEPVNGAAVDEGGELAEASAEQLKDNIKVFNLVGFVIIYQLKKVHGW